MINKLKFAVKFILALTIVVSIFILGMLALLANIVMDLYEDR